MEELEQSVRQMMAKSFIDGLLEETKNEIMARSLETSFEKMVKSWEVEHEIKDLLHDAMRDYVHEYIADPIVQARLKQSAHETVDVLFNAVIKSMEIDLQRNMKSEYHNFLKGD